MRDQFGLRIGRGWFSPAGYRMIFESGSTSPPGHSVGRGWAVGLANRLTDSPPLWSRKIEGRRGCEISSPQPPHQPKPNKQQIM